MLILFLTFDFRAVLGMTLLYAGLEQTSPAFASALANLIPSMTFILAVLCRYQDSSPFCNSQVFPFILFLFFYNYFVENALRDTVF